MSCSSSHVFAALAISLIALICFCDAEHIRVCVIPHSHTDPGWKITFEEYHELIVKSILERMFTDLKRNPSHKFIWSETSFLHRWYTSLSATQEFVGGGWVQHDEALVTPYAAVSQMSEGHLWLNSTFNVSVEIGYQIDPFGHSALTPILFRALGFKSAVINRIDWRIKNALGKTGSKEFLWLASSNDSIDEALFTHLIFDHYSSSSKPDGYDFERRSVPINQTNVAERVAKFVDMMKQRRSHYPTNELLFLWGDDFRFANPDMMFSSMDRLLEYITKNEKHFGLSASYCIMSEYLSRVRAAMTSTSSSLSIRTGSFLPYSASLLDPWTGFYSTRPLLKHRIRQAEAALRSAEVLQLAVFLQQKTLSSSTLEESLTNARRLFSILQHHDAVTGTCAPHVYLDYTRKVLSSISLAGNVSSAYLSHLLNSPLTPLGPGNTPLSVPKASGSLVLFNPLPIQRKETIELVSNEPLIISMNQVALPVSILPQADGSYNCFVSISLSPFSRANLAIDVNKSFSSSPPSSSPIDTSIVIGSSAHDSFSAAFSRLGELQSLTKGNSTVQVTPSFYTYASGKWLGSGAYLFRLRFWPSFLIGLGIGSVGGTVAGAMLGLALGRSVLRKSPWMVATARRSALLGLVLGALIFYALSRRTAHDESGDQMLGIQIGVFLAAMSCAIAGVRRHAVMALCVVVGFTIAFTLLPSLHSHHINLSSASVLVTRTPHVEQVLVTSPDAGLVQQSRIYTDGEFLDVVIGVSMAKRPNEELVLRIPFASSDTTVVESDDGIHMDERVAFSYLDLVPRNYYPLISHLRLKSPPSALPPLSILSAQSLGFGVLPSSVEVKLNRRLMQDDEQGLNAPIDDSEVPQLHFRFALNPPQTAAALLNNPLQAFHTSESLSTSSALDVLSFLPQDTILLHVVSLSQTTIGILLEAADHDCIDDESVCAHLNKLTKCFAVSSDASFTREKPFTCRRHFAAYILICK